MVRVICNKAGDNQPYCDECPHSESHEPFPDTWDSELDCDKVTDLCGNGKKNIKVRCIKEE